MLLCIAGDHDGGPDGMDFDYEGNLLVANWGSGYIDVSLVTNIDIIVHNHYSRVEHPDRDRDEFSHYINWFV